MEQHLNASGDIEEPLHRLFRAENVSWHPYLYWGLLIGLHTGSPETEATTGKLIADWEKFSLEAGQLPGVLFSFAGSAAS